MFRLFSDTLLVFLSHPVFPKPSPPLAHPNAQSNPNPKSISRFFKMIESRLSPHTSYKCMSKGPETTQKKTKKELKNNGRFCPKRKCKKCGSQTRESDRTRDRVQRDPLVGHHRNSRFSSLIFSSILVQLF